jgi:TPR repeat protein
MLAAVSIVVLTTATKQGRALAQFSSGCMYLHGQGSALNYKGAARWFRKAADQYYAQAQNNLGVMYRKGQEGAQDYWEAVCWTRKSADQEFAGA